MIFLHRRFYVELADRTFFVVLEPRVDALFVQDMETWKTSNLVVGC